MNAKCPRCSTNIQLDNQSKVGFCSSCGGRVVVQEAIKHYNQEHKNEMEQKQQKEEQERVLDRSFMRDALLLLEQGSFETATTMFMDVWRRDPNNYEAGWGYIRGVTKNLSSFALKSPSDYAGEEAAALFAPDAAVAEQGWRKQYYDAFAKSCIMTAESVDHRVFVQLEIFRWSPQNHTFMYPVSRDFDIDPILEKTVWKTWEPLREALPPEYREDFTAACTAACQRIREYFVSGFTNLEALKNGDYSLLLGAWSLKLTTGATRIDVLNFAVNPAKLPYFEAMRCNLNHYDYYRNFRIDSRNSLTCSEHRHFPSLIGVGGDFVSGEIAEPAFTLVAVYEYILVMPNALYTRVALNKIPGIERALTYNQKCYSLPCFQRSSKKSAVQIMPLAANFDSAEPSKKVKSCYVATAVYGDEDAPEVRLLRNFRDRYLNRNAPGRRLTALYYRLSPPIANRLRHKKGINRLVRGLLDGFLRFMGDRLS